jgi:hypothetical protein
VITLEVVRTDKHSQAKTVFSFADAVNNLASIMPASIYNSRMEIAADLMNRGSIETLGYVYSVRKFEPLDAAESFLD